MGLSKSDEALLKFENSIKRLRSEKDSLTDEEYLKKLDILQKLYLKELNMIQDKSDKLKLYKPKISKEDRSYKDINSEVTLYQYKKHFKRSVEYKLPPIEQYLEGEEFKVIPGYDGKYYLSNKGRCWSCPRYVDIGRGYRIIGGCFLKPCRNKGRLMYQLSVFSDNNNKTLDRINIKRYVLGLFKYNSIDEVPCRIDYIDGNIYNNSVENLKPVYSSSDKKLYEFLDKQSKIVKFLKQYIWYRLGEGFENYIITFDTECIVKINKFNGFIQYKILKGYLPVDSKYNYYKLTNSQTGKTKYNSYNYFLNYLNSLETKEEYIIESYIEDITGEDYASTS